MKKIVALLLCLCLFACHNEQKETQEIQVLALRGPSAIVLAQWIEQPPVIAGRQVVVRLADSPDQVVAAMVKGETDIAVLPMINAANLHNKGLPYRLAGCPIWGNLYGVGREGARQIHVFAAGTTPDILTRYHIEKGNLPYSLNYTFDTPSEVVRALLSGNAQAAVLPEPFVSMVMQRDSSLHLLADLNHPISATPDFAETAVMIRQALPVAKEVVDGLLRASCLYANEEPERVIAVLEAEQVFPEGMLNKEAIRRCRINYRTAEEAEQDILSFLEIVQYYEPRAIGGKVPDFFPSFPQLLSMLGEQLISKSFYLSVGATLLRGCIGLVLSLGLALCFAAAFTRVRWLYELFRPLLILMRSVPVISFILFALIFFHPEGIPLLIGFLTMFPLLTENLTKGLRSLNPDLRVVGQQFRLSRRNRLTQIVYPQLKPFLFSGLASAAGFGWRAIIMGEVLSQSTLGIGSEMKRAQSFIDLPGLLAWTLVAILLSFLSDKTIHWLSKRDPGIIYRPGKSRRSSGMPIVADHLSYRYGVSDFSYRFMPVRIYGIAAPSGTGKTTLFNLLNGTLQPTEGSVTIDRTNGIASVFQEPLLLPHLTVRENVALVVASFNRREQAEEKADIILCDVEMQAYAESLPTQLSYGQQQRVALARALVYPSPYLFMDEPFKGLDQPLRLRLIDHLRQRQIKERQTILFTSHESDELFALADTILDLSKEVDLS